MVNSSERFLKVRGWKSEYKSVDRVLKYYRRKVKSEKTRRNVLDSLKALCKFADKNPDELIELSVKVVSNFVQTFLDNLDGKGRSKRYLNVNLAYFKTFFRVNGFQADKEIKVERYYQPSRYRKRPEYVPTSEEIERMIYAARNKRNKAVILMLYTTGLRISTLIALNVSDVIKELKDESGVIKVPVYSEMKERVPAACKGAIPYYSFASMETVEALREYLDERSKRFGGLSEEEPLFCSETTNLPDEVKRKTSIMRKSVQQLVKRAAKKAGIKEWKNVSPHCLRKAFESALRNNGLNVKDQEFLMGHILPGSQDAYYDYSKVEDLRAKYAGVRFFKENEVDKLEMIKTFAKTLGIKEIEIKIQKIVEEEPQIDEMEALGKIMRQELGVKPMEVKLTRHHEENKPTDCANNSRRYESKIVTENQLLPYLNEGWDIIKEFNNGKIVIRREFV